MSYQTKIITTENVIDQVKQLFSAGYRFVTATCVDERDKFRVIYSFDKDITLVNLEVETGKNEEILSISGVYLCAFLIENEMKELFGLKVTDIAVDLGGHMFMTDENHPHPMAKEAE